MFEATPRSPAATIDPPTSDFRRVTPQEIVRVATHGRRIEELLTKEWLLTNERGSFASATIAGCNTSGYHGLLVGSPDPLVRRLLALANCLETIRWNGRSLELATFEFADRFAPPGYAHLHEFRRDTGAHFLFRTDPADLCKSIYLARGQDTVLVEYTFHEVRAPVELVLRPFVGMRDFHTLQRSDAPLVCRIVDRAVCVQNSASADCELWLGGPALGFETDPQWWFNFVYRTNRARGLPHAEDLWAPGVFRGRIDGPGRIVFWAHLTDVAQPPPAESRTGRPNAIDGDGGPAPPEAAVPLVDPEAIKEDLAAHQERLIERAGARDKAHRTLCLAADQFVARRNSAAGARTTIVAGFPWFADWGRDTFLSLPGLLLATGRHEEAGSVLRTFAAALDGGMIPNRFDDRTGAAQYNSVDASLWFIHAAFEYLAAAEEEDRVASDGGATRFAGRPPSDVTSRATATESRSVSDVTSGATAARSSAVRDAFARDLFPAIRTILDTYHAGTRYGIRADADGLLTAGDRCTQLTWMDAQCGGVVFTPRCGKAVEVNALWHNALRRAQQFCESRVAGAEGPVAQRPVPDREEGEKVGRSEGEKTRRPSPVLTFSPSSRCGPEARATAAEAARYAAWAEQAGRSFCKLFWNHELDYLNDTILPDGAVDASLRPNQIFAVSLPFGPPLARVQQWAIVNAVERRLLTPYGPRTLSSHAPAYKGRYEGPLRQRDEAYHQGTVWPYLLGPFLEAYLKVRQYSPESRSDAAELLRPLLHHLTADGCLGSICEVFDGDPIHRPGGCWAQAWSVAEVLRLYRLVAAE